MSVGVLVAFWVVAGIAVVLIAMSATRRNRKGDANKESRSSTTTTLVAVVAAFVVLGGVIPAFVMISNADDDAKAKGGVDLTSQQVEGRQLFAEHCSTCHTLAASNAVGKVGPNLDTMRPAAELTVNAIEEGRARGMGQMPAELLDGAEAEAVASYVAAVAGH